MDALHDDAPAGLVAAAAVAALTAGGLDGLGLDDGGDGRGGGARHFDGFSWGMLVAEEVVIAR